MRPTIGSDYWNISFKGLTAAEKITVLPWLISIVIITFATSSILTGLFLY